MFSLSPDAFDWLCLLMQDPVEQSDARVAGDWSFQMYELTSYPLIQLCHWVRHQ